MINSCHLDDVRRDDPVLDDTLDLEDWLITLATQIGVGDAPSYVARETLEEEVTHAESPKGRSR